MTKKPKVIFVKIKPESILWRIFPEYIQKGKEQKVRLKWGWTAGLTKKQLKKIAPDAPVGHAEVMTTLRDAKELRDGLSKILREHKEIPRKEFGSRKFWKAFSRRIKGPN